MYHLSENDTNATTIAFQQITANNAVSIVALGIGANINLTNITNHWFPINNIDNLSPPSQNIAINATNFARNAICTLSPYQS